MRERVRGIREMTTDQHSHRSLHSKAVLAWESLYPKLTVISETIPYNRCSLAVACEELPAVGTEARQRE